MQIMIVNTVLNNVLISISKIKLNWNASSKNNVKWCITTESNIKENLSGVKTSFNFTV